MLYRGPLAIHAAMKVDADACYEFGYSPLTIPRGAVLCIVEVKRCVQFPNSLVVPDPYGDFSDGRFGFLLAILKKFNPPIPAKGHQKMWNWMPPREAKL
jgi:hypothetical protein